MKILLRSLDSLSLGHRSSSFKFKKIRKLRRIFSNRFQQFYFFMLPKPTKSHFLSVLHNNEIEIKVRIGISPTYLELGMFLGKREAATNNAFSPKNDLLGKLKHTHLIPYGKTFRAFFLGRGRSHSAFGVFMYF